MLLSVGERTSMALISMALNDLGVSAISFTGSQAGILTDDDHFNAKIIDVRADRVREALGQGKIVVLAGFQGVSPTTKEITTLGRGGSDVTAVAMAAAFRAERCEILKEVPAVFTADPRQVPEARPLTRLSYESLLEMCFWGAKVLHHRSVSLARASKVPLYIGPADDARAVGTLADEGGPVYEQVRPVALNSHHRVIAVSLASADLSSAWSEFDRRRARAEIATPQLLGSRLTGERAMFFLTAPEETLRALETAADENTWLVDQGDLCSVSLTCSGVIPHDLPGRALGLLASRSVRPFEMRVGALSLTFFLKKSELAEASRQLHTLIPA
jgi:aspartate kinase